MRKPSPANRLEILLEMHRYNVELGRAYLEYRERLTQVVITIYSGLLGIVFAFKIELFSAFFPLMVVVFSRFTETFVLKFYERSEYHFARSRHLRLCIDREFSNGVDSIEVIFKDALNDHKTNFRVKGREAWGKYILNSNVHERWAALHRLFSYTGVILEPDRKRSWVISV